MIQGTRNLRNTISIPVINCNFVIRFGELTS